MDFCPARLAATDKKTTKSGAALPPLRHFTFCGRVCYNEIKGGESMKISLVLKESIYDCQVEITDSQGTRYYYLPALAESETVHPFVWAEVYDSEFDMTLTPIVPDTSSMMDEIESNTWKEKFAKKVVGALLSSLEKVPMRVACRYHVDQIEEGDRLVVALQGYFFGTFDRYDLLDLFPVMYMFFEVFRVDKQFALTTAFATNRKEVLKAARALTFAGVWGIDWLFTLLLAYPFQLGRVKHLTRNKKIAKTLIEFNRLSDAERQRFLEKQEEIMNR
ncbi:MAG: hypothetical protein IJC33_00865 [Clostridia bacterium]|nr:hypothetical protein [Clostridia bacterium]